MDIDNFWKVISLTKLKENKFFIDVVRYKLLKEYSATELNNFINEYTCVKEEIINKLNYLKVNSDMIESICPYIIFRGQKEFNLFLEDPKLYVNNIDFLKSHINKYKGADLLFLNIEEGNGFPHIKDADNVFFSLSTINCEMLSKMLMVGVKDLVVKELINKGFSEQEIKLLLLKEKIKNL
jgi:hypothetical protein